MDEMSLAYMDEIDVPERHRDAAPPVEVVRTHGRGHRLTRREAFESLARYAAKRGHRHTRKAYAGLGDDVTFSRFVKVPGREPPARPRQLVMEHRHPAFSEGRSFFSARGVRHPSMLNNLLVSGHSNVKLGRDVRRGAHRGYWIYTLTLEERATCPRSCAHWTTCYGNNMPYAKRVDHRDQAELERRLAAEVGRLLANPRRVGILIRLHALGDFFSPTYVQFWSNMLAQHPRLAIYGYTARRPGEPIGAEVAAARTLWGRRFAVRWSDGGLATGCTVSVHSASEAPPTAFVCPEQTGRVDGCGKCGACWTGVKNVAFLAH